ncbi:MAG: RNA polymerase sigma factor [Planctomycetota bacterium]|nr:RNA polymerase sigma factor [Planctomycetota bacterium]
MPSDSDISDGRGQLGAEGFHDLVRLAQDGDRKAMDDVLSILRPYLEPIARPFANPARPVESTSDLLQESCLRAWHKIGSFRGGDNDEKTFAMFRAWVGQIVRRLGLTAQRDRQSQKRIPQQKILRLAPSRVTDSTASGRGMDPRAPDPSPSSSARANERAQGVRAALGRIPNETDAAILRMRWIEGMTLKEISERLHVHYEKVRDRYRLTMLGMERDLKDLL